ncbi:MAG: hypothetical protein ACI4IH_03380 [Eubacterium sp.]
MKKCIHSYKEKYVSPKWLEKGEVRTVCEKCGDVLCVEYTPQASGIYAEFLDIINTKEGGSN